MCGHHPLPCKSFGWCAASPNLQSSKRGLRSPPPIVDNQQVVMPYYLAYKEVRKSVVERSIVGPVETLIHGLFKDSSDWDEVKFVSEKQVIEQMAGK